VRRLTPLSYRGGLTPLSYRGGLTPLSGLEKSIIANDDAMDIAR